MAIIVNLDVMMAKRKIALGDNRQIYSNLKKMNSLFKGFIDCLLTMCKCID